MSGAGAQQPAPTLAACSTSDDQGSRKPSSPTCASGLTLPRNNSPSDANCPTLPDSNPIQSLSNVCRHVFAHLRPNRKTTPLSPIRVSMQLTKLPLPRMPTPHSTLSRLSLPHSPQRSPRPSLAPQLHSSAHHCQRLPSSLLIENASGQFLAPSAPCPEAFPIKANVYSATWTRVAPSVSALAI
jgi:hypothetical protein